MESVINQPRRGRGRALVIIAAGIVAVVIALVTYAYYVGMPLAFVGARLIGSGRSTSFVPLVSHSHSSSGPCFDAGSQDCERQGYNQGHTVGFLFQQRPSGLPSDPLYGCADSSNSFGQYVLSTTYTECRQKGLTPHQYGYVAQSKNFENSTPLIYCEDTGEAVSNAAVCIGTARQLGYMTAVR